MRRVAAAVALVVIVAAGCGGDDSESTSDTEGNPTVTADESAPGGDEVTDQPTEVVEPTAEATATPEPTAPPVVESELAEPLGLESIAITTPEEGGGDRPDLEWEPVDDAALYHVTVLAPDGSIYWGWTGSETSVPFGGFPRLIPEAAGPRIIAGMTWTVLAVDAEALPLAIGGPRPLSP